MKADFLSRAALVLTLAASLTASGADNPPRITQVTFTAIEPGDRIVLNGEHVRGRVTVDFVAIERDEADDTGEAPARPRARIDRDGAGPPAITFLEALPAGLKLVFAGSEGDMASVVTGPVDPALVSGGQGQFVVETPAGQSPGEITIAEGVETGAQSSWVARRERADGVVESAISASNLPPDACTDGSVRFTGPDGPDMEVRAVCVDYLMARAFRTGDTQALQARVTGAGDETRLRFTFVSRNPGLQLGRPSVTMSVGEINAGATLTEVTGLMGGGHTFDATAKIVRDPDPPTATQ